MIILIFIYDHLFMRKLIFSFTLKKGKFPSICGKEVRIMVKEMEVILFYNAFTNIILILILNCENFSYI
jgi:hypothetical protein